MPRMPAAASTRHYHFPLLSFREKAASVWAVGTGYIVLEEYGLDSMEHPRQLQRHQRTAVLMKIGDGGQSGDDSSCMPTYLLDMAMI